MITSSLTWWCSRDKSVEVGKTIRFVRLTWGPLMNSSIGRRVVRRLIMWLENESAGLCGTNVTVWKVRWVLPNSKLHHVLCWRSDYLTTDDDPVARIETG